jgi:trimeric autotransporter adhesin
MDQLQTRLDALEQQMHTVNRRLRWWRGLAGGLLVLAVLTWALPSGIAQEDTSTGGQRGLAQRVAALEDLLKHFSREDNEVFLTGANLHIVNGLDATQTTNGLGNLIVGYNESRNDPDSPDVRTGSHNVVVGQRHNFSRFGGLVVGDLSTISGDFAVVSSGSQNTARGTFAVVSGGSHNTASGSSAAVSGGAGNTASGEFAVVSGGTGNTASGSSAVVSGGSQNTASGEFGAFVSGGTANTASSDFAAVSGGAGNTASGDGSVVSGGGRSDLFISPGNSVGNEASGLLAVVSGGGGNTASGVNATVSGGQNRTADGEFEWVAGSLAEDD